MTGSEGAVAVTVAKILLVLRQPIIDVLSYTKSKVGFKKNTLHEGSLRKGFFWYKGEEFDDGIKKIFSELEANGSVETEDALVFTALNDRFSVFKANSMNQRHVIQSRRSKFQKKYQRIFDRFHDQYISKFDYSFEGNGVEDPAPNLFNFLKLDKEILWVLGEIGCGKSTFISHLCHLLNRYNSSSKENDIAIVTINFNCEKHNGASPDEVILNLLNEAFQRQFKQVGKISSLESLNDQIKKYYSNYHLNIVIDNLDELYDESSKLILRTKGNAEEFEKFYQQTTYLPVVIELFRMIHQFTSTHQSSKVKFIVCLRQETFHALDFLYKKITGSNTCRPFKSESKLIINSPTRSFVSEVVNNRFKIFGNKVNPKFNEFLVKFSQKAMKLKINGLRHVMENARSLLYLKNQEHLFFPEWMIDIYVYIDGYESYSQRNCGVSNIFLVNIDYRNDSDELHQKWPEATKSDHFQSYWLKYFLASHVRGHTTNSLRARRYFFNYEEGIVTFSLYSLSEVDHGKLIACDGSEDAEGYLTHKISATERLGYCLDKDMFFDFSYLSVIVEDEYLEFPKLTNENLNRDLCSLFRSKNSHGEFFSKDPAWENWLTITSKKVLVFFQLLRSSYENYESVLHPDLSCIDIEFEQIENDLLKSIELIGGTLELDTLKVNAIVNNAKSEQKKYEKAFYTHFKDYKKIKSEIKNK